MITINKPNQVNTNNVPLDLGDMIKICGLHTYSGYFEEESYFIICQPSGSKVILLQVMDKSDMFNRAFDDVIHVDWGTFTTDVVVKYFKNYHNVSVTVEKVKYDLTINLKS